MATAHCLDFHQFNETYLHELRAQDVTTEAHFVAYFSKILHNKLRRPADVSGAYQGCAAGNPVAGLGGGTGRRRYPPAGTVWRFCEFGLQQHTPGIVSLARADQAAGRPATRSHGPIAGAGRDAAGGRNQNAGTARTGKASTPRTRRFCEQFSLSKETRMKCAWNWA